jgi:acetyl-CoA carboxylase carboxyltransferase component
MTEATVEVYEELRERTRVATLGGSAPQRRKQIKAGKLLVRDRLRYLLDDEPEFEDGALARHEEGLPGDAVVTCVGKIDGRTVCVIANDFTIKAGTWGKRTFEKITRMQDLADQLGAPIVYLMDAAGARIDEQFENYAGRKAWGNIFYNQVQYSGRVPQICALFGPSPAGSAYVPALCDLMIMVRGTATAYIGSPRAAEMVTGEKVSLEEMGGADMHARVSGLCDLVAETEVEALDAVRAYLGYLPSSWRQAPPSVDALQPIKGTQSLRELIPADESIPFDVMELIEGFVDANSILEYKREFAAEMVTAFARIDGETIGIVANQSQHRAGVLFSDSSDKAARFIWLCNAYNVPLLFLMDVPGYMIGTAAERDGIIRHGAKMLFAVAESRVPRIAVIVRKAYGGGYLGMSGSPMGPDAVLALPTAQPALLGPEAAVHSVHYNQMMSIADKGERDAFVAQKRAEYAADIDVFQIANENAVEEVVQPEDLRAQLSRRFAVYKRSRRSRIKRHTGVYPV